MYNDSNYVIFYANNDTLFTGDFNIEFDIVSFDYGFTMRVYTSQNNNIYSNSLQATQTSHILIQSLNNVVTIYCDGNLRETLNSSVGVDLGFRVEKDKTLQFNNFHVYSF